MNGEASRSGDHWGKKVVAVNQPYIFPYLGYFQLIHAADVFVVYDDVQWIKGGWINRNRILSDGAAQYLTLPVAKAPLHRMIRDHEFADQFDSFRAGLLRRLELAYRKAPRYQDVMPLIETCLWYEDRNVCGFVLNALRLWCDYLGITTRFLRSSQLALDPLLKGVERVLAINGLLGASRYVNLIGGKKIYQECSFSVRRIELRFVKTRPLSYVQVGGLPFVPGLSIIDVAMNNSPGDLRRLLLEYDLVRGSENGER